MEKILEYLKEHVGVIHELVSECNSWNGSLEEYDYYENDEDFFNTFFSGNPMEAVRAVHYGEYNYMDAYVKFNVYGNLKSVGEYEFEDELINGVEDIFDTWYNEYLQNNVDTYDDTLKELIEEMEQKEESEEE